MNSSFIPAVQRRRGWFRPLAGAALTCVAAAVIVAESPGGADSREVQGESAPKDQAAAPSAAPAAALQAAVAAARERAKLLHDVYATTLDVMHVHYFRRDGPVLPARAMEDVFTGVAGLSGSQANWISVNTTAMSINHEPTTAFEKKAAAELAAGKKEYEYVGKGVYRRAAAIPLRTSCVGCHTKMFSEPPKTPRFAGLVISVPLKLEEK